VWATCAVRVWPTEQRGRGEADRWATGTVSSDGTDRQAGPGWRWEREGGERGAGARGPARSDVEWAETWMNSSI
jgi:hypothetical protein